MVDGLSSRQWRMHSPNGGGYIIIIIRMEGYHELQRRVQVQLMKILQYGGDLYSVWWKVRTLVEGFPKVISIQ